MRKPPGQHQHRPADTRHRFGNGLWLPAVIVLAAVTAFAGISIPGNARKVVLPIYAEGQPEAVAVLRIDHLFTEHQRLSFFQVKLMPLLVAQGVRLELRPGSLSTNALAGLPRALRTLGNRTPVELREFQLFLPGQPLASLAAQRARLPVSEASGGWSLDHVVLHRTNGSLAVPRARLPLDAGPARLIWQTDRGSIQYHFLTRTLLTNQVALLNSPEKSL